MRIDGKKVALQLRQQAQERVEQLQARKGVTPGLAVVIVGEDPASTIYVRNKENACNEAGIYSQVIRLPEQTTQDELDAIIQRLNKDERIHGILVQLPLPNHLNEQNVIESIDYHKDVDGFHRMNAGSLVVGMKGLVSCTPRGCIELIKQTGVALAGKHAVVLGRSNIVGKPVALLLLQENATVTICHSKTENLPAILQQADILVAAIGQPAFVKAEMIKENAIVIDVGINRLADGRVVGDVDFKNVEKKASFITPVPGGVGPMTIAMLLHNTIDAAESLC